MRPRDARVDEARRWRDIVDRQKARVRKRRPPIVMEQFGVGRGCVITRAVRDEYDFVAQIFGPEALRTGETHWYPSRRFFRDDVKMVEYPGSEYPPSHDHRAYMKRVQQMGIQAQRWTDTYLPEHGHDPKAPRRDFRELVMDVVQQTLDACEYWFLQN